MMVEVNVSMASVTVRVDADTKHKGWFHGNFVGLGGGYMVIWYVERKNCRIMIVYLVLLFFCIPV